MTAKRAAIALILICLLTSLAVVACSGDDDADSARTASASATAAQAVTMREPDWWTASAASVNRLFVRHTVVVGEVSGVDRPFDPAMRLYTVFTVRVETPLRGADIAEGDTIYVAQTGGTWQSTVFEEKDNSLLQPGTRYVLTIDPFSGVANDVDFHGYYLQQPFAQFALVMGSLQPKDPAWASLPAVAVLTGRSEADAEATIVALVEPTPIPDDTILAAIRAIPYMPEAEQPSPGGLYPEGQIALEAFVARTTIDDVFSFYGERLPALGWTSETGPQVVSYPGKGLGAETSTIGNWTLTRGDLRLVITTGSVPKDAPAGEIATQIRIEPLWFSGLESYSIPSICALPSAILAVHPLPSLCGHP